MKIQVKLCASAKELAGQDRLSVELPEGATIRDLRGAIATVMPPLARIIPHAMWAVDANYAADDTRLTEQSEVALIPPVSGG